MATVPDVVDEVRLEATLEAMLEVTLVLDAWWPTLLLLVRLGARLDAGCLLVPEVLTLAAMLLPNVENDSEDPTCVMLLLRVRLGVRLHLGCLLGLEALVGDDMMLPSSESSAEKDSDEVEWPTLLLLVRLGARADAGCLLVPEALTLDAMELSSPESPALLGPPLRTLEGGWVVCRLDNSGPTGALPLQEGGWVVFRLDKSGPADAPLLERYVRLAFETLSLALAHTARADSFPVVVGFESSLTFPSASVGWLALTSGLSGLFSSFSFGVANVFCSCFSPAFD